MLLMFVILLQINLNFSVFDIRLTIEGGLHRILPLITRDLQSRKYGM